MKMILWLKQSSYVGQQIQHHTEEYKDCYMTNQMLLRKTSRGEWNRWELVHQANVLRTPGWTLEQHKNNALMEHKRIEFTRYRLSSHNLKVETGRWGRVGRENRVCSCNVGGIQDEDHALLRWGFTNDLRQRYQIQTDSLDGVYNGKEDEVLCDIFYELSKIFVKWLVEIEFSSKIGLKRCYVP